jgi:hypothetical protein
VFTPQPELHPIYVANRTYAQGWTWGRNRRSNGNEELFCVLVFVLLFEAALIANVSDTFLSQVRGSWVTQAR